MITTTARCKTFFEILNPKKDTEQGRRRLPNSREIPIMSGVVHEVVDGTDVHAPGPRGVPCRVTVHLKSSLVLSLGWENDRELSIDILEKVKKVVQGEEQEDLAGTFKVSLRFGDTPDHLTLYVVDSDCSHSNVVIFGSEADLDAWGKIKQVLLDVTAVRVAFAENMAEIINKPYESDLDPWLKLVTREISKAEDEKNKGRIQKLKRILEAQCTLNMCAQVHPWAVRGTLHPWKTKDPASPECNYNLCESCEGRGGKDGGLYTGETLLHIVIVQRDHDSAKWLLDRSAMAAFHHSHFPFHFHRLCSCS